ncbi:MAG: hypothetical protein QG663_664, partial [Thermodesulfobacteriota bacterium]|nr:hypothetical protein [Thermodesulfobacteriota bacterium]
MVPKLDNDHNDEVEQDEWNLRLYVAG